MLGRRGNRKGSKRGAYKKRFHQPMFPFLTEKTTSPNGYKNYMKEYMRRVREMERKARMLRA
jgi:hypothetical protein